MMEGRAGHKPGSVIPKKFFEMAVIYLGRLLPDASSGLAGRETRPTRNR